MRRLPLLFSVFATACGGTDPLPCDFTEGADASNAATPEDTSVSIGNGTKQLCGKVDPGHFDANTQSVDLDTFHVTAPADGSYIIQLLGDDELSLLSDFRVVVRDTNPNPAILAEGRFDGTLANHLAFLADLPTGDFNVTVSASAGGDVSGAINYKLRFVQDKPDRCATITASASYTEASDGATNTGNDVLSADFTKDPQFTMSTGAPESTGISIDPSSKQRISGTSAQVTGTDQYQDRDTYQIQTGDDDELTVRLDWMGATTDLDFAVFEENTTNPAGLGNIGDPGAGEFQTFAVKPNTTYWVWVGNFNGGAAPMSYDLSICGGNLAP